jgi:hypothetical protein
MDAETFSEIVSDQIRLSKDVLVDKGRQYAGGDDKLHNFRVAAELQDVTMMEALSGMMAKHTVSIYDMLNSAELFSLDQWDEKITDHINYLLILAAVLRDEEGREFVLDGQNVLASEEMLMRQTVVDEPWSAFAKHLNNLFALDQPTKINPQRRKQ